MIVPGSANPLLIDAPSGYQISRSVRLRSSASAYFSRTPASASNRSTWTYSAWIKKAPIDFNTSMSLLSAGSFGSDLFTIQITDNGLSVPCIAVYGQISGSAVLQVSETPARRDPSAWFHMMVVLDTTQATASNRVKIYYNGEQVTALTTATYPSQNTTFAINNNQATAIGSRAGGSAPYYDGYMTEVNFIDGQALTPSSFGTTDTVTGVWNPIKYTGTYGTNGFYLNFSDNSGATATTIGKDSSGNGNNWTPNNISVTAGTTYDSMVDSPTNYGSDTGAGGELRGNYCVWNPINIETSTTISEANLKFLCSSGSSYNTCTGTISVSSGKWYWELTYTGASGDGSQTGILASTRNLAGLTTSAATGTWSDGYAYSSNGNKVNNGSGSAYGSTYTTGDVIGVALDLNAGTLVFYKNNTSQGTAYSSLSGSFVPSAGSFNSNYYQANFGQRPFSYTAPSGFKALCTQNLPVPTISNGANYMAATLYTGNGGTLAISNATNNISFQPDLVWVKSRSAATDHKWTDSVRGVTKGLISDTTGAETTDTNGLTAFGAGGFTLGSDTTYNNSGATYVGWQWQAGKGTTVSNTAGSITSTVSANTTAGFSVLTYTGNGTVGATVGHGLGVTPGMVIVKSRSATADWPVKILPYMTGGQRLELSTTNAITTEAAGSGSLWNATNPNSTVITLGNQAMTNANGTTYVAYCWSQITGYSAFGSYTGNGSTDGPFVYCGFRPRWLMIKRTNGVDSWVIEDSSRDTYNVNTKYLLADSSTAEGSATPPELRDFLANGFKSRSTNQNASGGTYIYAAFAENPFTISRAR
jgi:hypothetical protein